METAKSKTLLCFLVFRLCASAAAQQPQTQEPPRFRSSVEVTSLDVSVVDDRSRPLLDLKPEDFNVRIDDKPRKVVSAEWIPLTTDASAPPPPPPPDGYSTNENSTGGRLIVVAVDQPNIRFGGSLAISKAAASFIDRLAPSDRIAVAGIGSGAPATPFTADRQRIKQALGRMVGQKQPRGAVDLGHNISITEAIQIYQHADRYLLSEVEARECQGLPDRAFATCAQEVEIEVQALGQDTTHLADQTVNALRAMFMALRSIEGAKTLILISEGFVLTDQNLIIELGSLAAASRTSLYILRLDSTWFDASDARVARDPFGDRNAQLEGLDSLAGAARGTIFTVVGRPDNLFERIAAELSGYYLVAVESEPTDRDGKSHPIKIDVPRRGAQVRSRRQFINTPSDQAPNRTRHQAVAAALASPLITSALPLRLASFTLQGPERDKVQVLIHADIGTDYSSSRIATLAYLITDQTGKVVEERAFDSRLLPVMNGVPSPLQYKTGASLPPGDYAIKLAVSEGDRVGSVEHILHARLATSDTLAFSELMVGGPVESGDLVQPTVGYQVSFGSVHGYFEAYGAGADAVSVEYEIGTDETSPALINVDVTPRSAGDTRTIFSKVIPVHQLPPGKYLLRASVWVKNRSVKTMTRGFEIAAPKVLMTAADGLGGSVSVDAELFLPVDERTLSPPFAHREAIDTATLAAFRDRIPPQAKDAFEQGVTQLAAGDYAKAEQAFKSAIQPEIDSTPALAYLAVAFAASRHDVQAASAFQAALVDGEDIPQIYDWLAGALMRTHDYAGARAILEEAVQKWPSDLRFVKPLAMLYATFGRGREAVRTLERYLSERTDDRDAYYFGVQWIYTLHASGAAVHDRRQDLELAKQYAAAYERAAGPQTVLVKQWVTYLEGEK